MNRALHIAGIVWAATSFLILGLEGSAIWGCFGGAVIFLLCFLFGKERLPLWVYSAAVAVFLCGLTLWIRGDNFLLRASYAGKQLTVRGVVTDQVFYDDACRMRVRLNDENPVGLQNAVVQVYSKRGVDIWPGNVVEYTLQLQSGSLAAAGSKDIDFQAFGDSPRVLGKMETWEVKLAHLRRTIAGRFFSFLPEEEAAVVAGVLTGCTENIPNSLRTTYAKAGISHLLAVSGMHLTVMLSLFSVLLERSLFSRRQRALLEMALAVAFAFLTGFSPSILRAAGMYVLYRTAFLFGRDADGLNALGGALIFILIFNPYSVFSVSLQLSYLSTMGICGLSEPLCDGLTRVFTRRDSMTLYETSPRLRMLFSMISVSLCAQIFTLPLACWYFGRISIVGPLVNLLILLPGSGLLLFGLLASVFGFFPALTGVFRMFAFLGGLCARVITWFAKCFAGIPGASFLLQDDVVIIYLTACIVLLLFLWYRRALAKYFTWTCAWGAGTLAALCFLRLVFWGYPLTLTVPDYGTSVLLHYGNQAVLLGTPKDSGEVENLLAIMEDFRVERLSLLLTAQEVDMNAYALQLVTKRYPPENLLHMDTHKNFDAQLFAGIQLYKAADTQVLLDWNGLTVAKLFSKGTASAHIAIAHNNVTEIDNRLHIMENARYYQSTRYFFHVLKDDEEDVREVSD